MKLSKNYSLKTLNSFSVDVKTKIYTNVFSVDELKEVILANELSHLKKFILGGGSNILFTKDFDGIVIKNSIPGIKINSEDDKNVIVESGAGVIWDELVQYCVDRNYSGIENLSLIPGSVGAAPIQNIGAYGQELKNTLFELSGIIIETGEEKIFDNSECKFSYRNSIFKNELKDKLIITFVKLKLDKNPKINLTYNPVKEEVEKRHIQNPTIKDIREIIIGIRKNKLPDPNEIGNAGSFFKNPVITIEKYNALKKVYPDLNYFPVDENNVKVSAARLIEICEWKGKRIGNVGTYNKQPLVIINFGDASGEEIYAIAMKIKDEVKKRFDISLENEVNVL
ncbi:MAG: UDP-N-acetylmuramate dehydrogenase [Ignavibacteria bacterium]|nr:MAG: UDP-N-acetylmuramate dehydrogenase [Ignavibacteria bacterium]